MALPLAILFDLDDTIITDGDRSVALLEAAHAFAGRLGPHAPAAIATRIEADLEAFWADPAASRTARLGAAWGIREARLSVIGATFASLDIAGSAALAAEFCDLFAARRSARSRVFDGALETVAALRLQGVRLALVTNGATDIQRAKLQKFALAPLFDHIQIEGEHGFGKPEERAYLHAMDSLGVTAADCWMVGDNLEWEVAAPQRLGLFGIWHDHLRKGLPAGCTVRPDRIVTSLPELLEAV